MAKLIINNMKWFSDQNPIVNEIIFKLIEDFKPITINTSVGVEFFQELIDCSWIYFLVRKDEEIEVQDGDNCLSIDVAALLNFKAKGLKLTVDELCDVIVGTGLFSMTADLIVQAILDNEEKVNTKDIVNLVATYLKVDLNSYDIIWDNSHENGANFPLFLMLK